MSAIEVASGIVWLDELQSLDCTELATKNTTREHAKLYMQLVDIFDEHQSIDRLKGGVDTLNAYDVATLGGDITRDCAVFDAKTGEQIGWIPCTHVRPELERFVDANGQTFFVIDRVHADRYTPKKAFGVTALTAVELSDGEMLPMQPHVMRAVRKFITRFNYVN